MDKKRFRFGMFLVTIGIVYGDVGTSPMYVMKSILEGNGGIATVSEELIVGALSLVIWTLTLLTTVKYVLIALRADNHGEGGIFSLYSLVKNKATWLILPAMIGGSALLADGVLTPAVTVTTAVEGLRTIPVMDKLLGSGQTAVIIITLVIICLLFSVQRAGTSRIGSAFGPVMLVWFGFLGIMGTWGMLSAPVVLKAFNPLYAVRILVSPCNKMGFMILGSVFLATTGAEALYSDMGHVGRENVYFSWPFVKICLILNYLGQGAWILHSRSDEALWQIADLNPFFQMLPPGLRPFAVVLGAMAAVIASQALITGSYTLVSEATRLNLMPHLEIRYPADTKGQLYIGTVNKILWIGCIIVILYFRSGARMENAYGLSITIAMLTTTMLLATYLWMQSKKILAVSVAAVFGVIESVFFISSLGKFALGGYVAVLLALALLAVMVIWYRATQLERKYCVRLRLFDYVEKLRALHDDESIPPMAHNLVFLGLGDNATIDRDILYSILDKGPKRAAAYWFISVNVQDAPFVRDYHVETFGTDFIFKIDLDLGFKVEQKVNIYLRQIVNDLLQSGELPPQNRLHSIYGPSQVGTFKFCMLRKSVPSKTVLSTFDERILRAKYAIRRLAGSREKWYGLDTSSLVVESVPLTVGSGDTKLLERKR